MQPAQRLDFYELQRRQWQRSWLIFGALIGFYFMAFGLIALAVFASLGFLAAHDYLSGPFLLKLLIGVLGAALFIAVFHFFDARKFGAAYIVKRLAAQSPDLADRYHKQFADTVEEMRIAAGLPQVKPYVIPSFGVNSLALIEADGTPAVAVTEGLLADCTRDELQAVSAHELAHISRGDAFYVTLVCSLANFLEKLRDALEPEEAPAEDRVASGRGGAPPVLIYAVVVSTSLIMHLLSTLLSREREILADAAASEISRNPAAIARALYKAHLKSTFVGDFSLTYSPLFIVAPELSSDDVEGFFSRLFNSHPPLMKRIKLLAQQANLAPAQIIEQVWESQRMRENARGVVLSFEELIQTGPSAEVKGPEVPASTPKTWLIQDRGGKWQGPFGLEELCFLPYFTPLRIVKNVPENIEAQAREFPQIRRGLQNLGQKKPLDPGKQNHCPRCGIPLADLFYEGINVQACGRCGGKLVEASHVDRVLLRREIGFSETLLAKARDFREQFLLNPVKRHQAKQKDAQSLLCPSCGYRMVGRPYNYQYIIPVNKCFSCSKIWFDADELEILQILVEKKA
jgi:Zn-dependent protease with chaperone function/Zn-finger nucleic acid-binding protein